MSTEVRLKVPRRAMPTIIMLAGLSSDRRQKLKAALEASPRAISMTELRSRVEVALASDGEQPESRDVVGELFSLAALAGSHGYDFEAVANSVAQASELDLEADARIVLAELLSDLLNSPAVRTLGKASDLAREHERQLHTVRVITDVRPVFEEAADEPIGAVVVHKLRISYFHSGRSDSIEVAMTTRDLSDVIGTASRAQRKAEALELMLRRTSLTSFDTEVEEV